jgi:hypothetical protein
MKAQSLDIRTIQPIAFPVKMDIAIKVLLFVSILTFINVIAFM